MLLKVFKNKKFKLKTVAKSTLLSLLLSLGLFVVTSVNSKVYSIEPFPLTEFQSNASNAEQVEFCKEVLRQTLPLLEKDPAKLTADEQNFLDFAMFLYDASYICTGRVSHQLLTDFKGFHKLPDDKLVILKMTKDELLTKDTLPLFMKHYPTCSNYKTFKEQVRCIYDESKGLAHIKPVSPFPSNYFNFFTMALLNEKFPNKILLAQYEPYFEGITRITEDRFSNKLKNFRKNPTKPVCIFKDNVLECPLFNLEKNFTPDKEKVNFAKSIFPLGIMEINGKNKVIATITFNPERIPKETACYQVIYTSEGTPEKVELLYKINAEITVATTNGKVRPVGGLGKPSEDFKKSSQTCNYSPLLFSFTKSFINWIEKEFFNPNYPRLPYLKSSDNK